MFHSLVIMSGEWTSFFSEAGFQPDLCEKYGSIFRENCITRRQLPELDRCILREMGITAMGHIMMILKHARKETPATRTLKRYLPRDEEASPPLLLRASKKLGSMKSRKVQSMKEEDEEEKTSLSFSVTIGSQRRVRKAESVFRRLGKSSASASCTGDESESESDVSREEEAGDALQYQGVLKRPSKLDDDDETFVTVGGKKIKSRMVSDSMLSKR
ncbi:unnamed protein product [Cyprideis torosa]|uniref:Uncharacterized protein n=1 Tax=Cyprideis torosa TaxID=163714 RepID=A0A7R8ZS51_9CRUS|nr:unnamed protein product [Cyprideis torosa]CAG0895427.1 unnamed protein product [Cyprideis torosa]